MDSNLRMTKYFRDSIAAKLPIDFKNSEYEIVSLEEVELGKISENNLQKIFKEKSGNKLEVIIVAKTIKRIFTVQEGVNNNNDTLSGIFFIPALLDENGELYPSENKSPWIPREYLYPIVDTTLAVGHLEAFDDFMTNHHNELKNSTDWKTYFNLCKEMYEAVTGSKITDQSVNGIELEDKIYLLKDNSIVSTRSILKLYDFLQEGDYLKSKLYLNFIKQEFSPIKPLIKNSIEESKKHIGQMNGIHKLSPSQRECLIHFNNMEDGDILAVNGPPGTGKTTLLQSLVANLYVERALKKEKPPLIVASSTNNQAVTNIIESFGKITKKWKHSNLENRWIEGVNSFAVYFPSTRKVNEAEKKGFQHTNQKGENFFERVESDENIQASKEKFLRECSHYFNTKINTLNECEDIIWQRLKEIKKYTDDILQLFHEFFEICNGEKSINAFIQAIEKEIAADREKLDYINHRKNEWQNEYRRIPFYYRWLKFIPTFKQKILNRLSIFISPEEDFLKESMDIDEIFDKYSSIAKEVRTNLREKEEVSKKVI